MIVKEANSVTTQRNSKRVEAYHLYVYHDQKSLSVFSSWVFFRKHAIENTDMLDFLREIVQAVPDPSAGGTIDLESERADGRRKRGAPRKRRKKAEEGDEEGDGEEELTQATKQLEVQDDDGYGKYRSDDEDWQDE